MVQWLCCWGPGAWVDGGDFGNEEVKSWIVKEGVC